MVKADFRIGTVIIAIMFSVGVFGLTAVRALVYPETEPASHLITYAQYASNTTPAQPSALPARLVIPAIGVDTAVEHVGVGVSGNMAVPMSYDNVGWYRLGTVPGDLGSAVVGGHVTNGLMMPSVFNRLGELQAGDEIIVETNGGDRIRFAVVDAQRYRYNKVPRDLLFNRNDAQWLNLITCDGGWLASKRTYDERVVIYAMSIS